MAALIVKERALARLEKDGHGHRDGRSSKSPTANFAEQSWRRMAARPPKVGLARVWHLQSLSKIRALPPFLEGVAA
jgi:hypothetical protein